MCTKHAAKCLAFGGIAVFLIASIKFSFNGILLEVIAGTGECILQEQLVLDPKHNRRTASGTERQVLQISTRIYCFKVAEVYQMQDVETQVSGYLAAKDVALGQWQVQSVESPELVGM